jgi:hypothetical protein
MIHHGRYSKGRKENPINYDSSWKIFKGFLFVLRSEKTVMSVSENVDFFLIFI